MYYFCFMAVSSTLVENIISIFHVDSVDPILHSFFSYLLSIFFCYKLAIRKNKKKRELYKSVSFGRLLTWLPYSELLGRRQITAISKYLMY